MDHTLLWWEQVMKNTYNGKGIIGVTTAFKLLELGYAVTLVDKANQPAT